MLLRECLLLHYSFLLLLVLLLRQCLMLHQHLLLLLLLVSKCLLCPGLLLCKCLLLLLLLSRKRLLLQERLLLLLLPLLGSNRLLVLSQRLLLHYCLLRNCRWSKGSGCMRWHLLLLHPAQLQCCRRLRLQLLLGNDSQRRCSRHQSLRRWWPQGSRHAGYQHVVQRWL